MTEQELVSLEIERRSLLEVVRQFTIHDCDPRMETGLNEFLTDLERKAAEIKAKIDNEL
jgi:hypothetical protein